MARKPDDNQPASSAMGTEDRTPHSGPSRSGGGFFEIRVKGHLDSHWSDWLEGLQANLLDNGEMILSGIIVDQAALMGVLNKLNRLNLTILSVSEVNQPE